MESSNHEKRHIFLAIGIVVLIAGPLTLSFVPQTLTSIIHHSTGVWHVFTPKESVVSYGVGLLFFFIACMILFLLDIRKLSLFISGLLVILSISAIFLASQSYKTLSDDSISFSPLFTLQEYSYSWDEVEKMVRVDENNTFFEYQLVFNDGNVLSLPYDAYFREIRRNFFYKIREMNIAIEVSEGQ